MTTSANVCRRDDCIDMGILCIDRGRLFSWKIEKELHLDCQASL